ncbi:MAG: serine hydrolase [Ignavibacteria bacterium]|nr:serine hydrolase [Ignavibacteria bacterium]MCC7158574.1 serine hydrolase [Ignavibacteria bacterium]
MTRIHRKTAGIWVLVVLMVFSLPLHTYTQDKAEKIDALVQKYFDLKQFNGSVLVAEDGNVIYSKGIGMADVEKQIPNKPDTKFRLASVTKQFTATLIMQLVEKGKIKLEGKLSDYLPYYRKDIGEKITIHQILSHTSGMDNYTDNLKFLQEESTKKVEPKEFILSHCSNDLKSEPGTEWAYSNSGYFILGAVIEEVTGKNYEDVLQENIFTPLGMTNSSIEVTGKAYENKASGYNNTLGELTPARPLDMTIPFSAGSIISTVEDMFKWDQALYTDKVLMNVSKEKMFTPVMNNYGYGWQIIEQPIGDMKKKVITHSGGIFGFNSLETRLVDENKFVMVLNNFENGNINQLTLGIVNILYGLEPAKPKESLALMLSKAIKEKGVKDAIAEMTGYKDKKDVYRINEGEINSLGYKLLLEKMTNEAIEVFKFNTVLYPASANVYDSLGEAYLEAGDKENAIINYRKSVELDPSNEHGKEVLQKLEAK